MRFSSSLRRGSVLAELLAVGAFLLLVAGLVRSLVANNPGALPAVLQIIAVEPPSAPRPVAMPVELPWRQSITFGTTAWRISMGRRQVVESANSALKGAFADLSRGFFRIMGLAAHCTSRRRVERNYTNSSRS